MFIIETYFTSLTDLETLPPLGEKLYSQQKDQLLIYKLIVLVLLLFLMIQLFVWVVVTITMKICMQPQEVILIFSTLII